MHSVPSRPGAMRSLLVAAALAIAWPAQAGESIRILVQSSPLAGSQYYALPARAAEIKLGDPLELKREPDNRHDANAVLVLWRGEKLGYLPRKENRAVARAMDEGMQLRAHVSRLRPEHADPWKRLEVAVQAEL